MLTGRFVFAAVIACASVGSLMQGAEAYQKSFALADVDDDHLAFAYKDGGEEIFRQHFQNNDHDGDGFIHLEENLEQLLHEGHWDLQELLADVDRNNDGAVDFEEYIYHIIQEHERAGVHHEL